jgi:hypothetical protein
MGKFHFNNSNKRVLDIEVQNYFEGAGHFATWRKNNEGTTESRKRSRRKVTNIKKYGARSERRKINQQLKAY